MNHLEPTPISLKVIEINIYMYLLGVQKTYSHFNCLYIHLNLNCLYWHKRVSTFWGHPVFPEIENRILKF